MDMKNGTVCFNCHRYREKYYDSKIKAYAFKSNKGIQGTPESPTILLSVRAYVQQMKLFPKPNDVNLNVTLKVPDINEFNINSPWHNFYLWACRYIYIYNLKTENKELFHSNKVMIDFNFNLIRYLESKINMRLSNRNKYF